MASNNDRKNGTDGNALTIPLWAFLSAHFVLLAYLFAMFLTRAHIKNSGIDLAGYEKIGTDILAHTTGPEGAYFHFHHYPPLANILFFFAKIFSGGLPFDYGLLAITVFFAISAIAYIRHDLQPSDARWVLFSFLVSILLLEPSVFFARFDFFPALAMVLSVLCVRRGKDFAGGVLLGAAIMLKFAPVFLLPLVFVCTKKPGRRSLMAGLVISILATWILHETIVGSSTTLTSFISFLTQRSGQPVYVLSTLGSLDFLFFKVLGLKATVVSLEPKLGDFVKDFPAYVPLMLQILALSGSVVIAFLARKDPRRLDHILLYAGATLFWVLFSSSFVTMHYYLWALPFAFLWFFENAEQGTAFTKLSLGVPAVATGIALLGQFIVPYGYKNLITLQAWLPILENVLRAGLTFFIVLLFLKIIISDEEETSPRKIR